MQFPARILHLGKQINSDHGDVPPRCPHDSALQHQMPSLISPVYCIRCPRNAMMIPAADPGYPQSPPLKWPLIEMVTVKVVFTVAAMRDTVLKRCAKWAGEGRSRADDAPRECGASGHLQIFLPCGMVGGSDTAPSVPLSQPLVYRKAGKWVKTQEETPCVSRGTCPAFLAPCLWLAIPVLGIPALLYHQSLFPRFWTQKSPVHLPCLNSRVSVLGTQVPLSSCLIHAHGCLSPQTLPYGCSLMSLSPCLDHQRLESLCLYPKHRAQCPASGKDFLLA